jgi:hypothetical protein
MKVMGKRLSLAAALLAGLLCSAIALAAMEQHNHGGGDNGAPPCGGVAELPQLRCAEAPGVTMDESGRLWIVWAYAGHLYVQHSQERGGSFSPAVTVNRLPEAISARGENRPKIAVNMVGKQRHVFVSWTTPLAKRFTGHIRFSRSLDGGEHFAEPLTVNDNLDITGHRFDALGVNAEGDIYLAWLDKRDRLKAEQGGGTYRGAALYMARSEDGGKSFLPNQKVLDHSCECCRVAIGFTPQQLPVVMWRHIYGDNIRDHALVTFRDKATPGQPRRVSFDEWQIDACPHHGPALAVSDSGVYHLTWFNNAPQRHGLFYANSRDGGERLSTPMGFGDYERGAAHPSVLALGQQVYLLWKEFDGTLTTVRLLRSADGGGSWSGAEVVAQSSGESDYPFLLSDGVAPFLSWHTRQEGYRLIPLSPLKDDAHVGH